MKEKLEKTAISEQIFNEPCAKQGNVCRTILGISRKRNKVERKRRIKLEQRTERES